jgi:hypothetical protein
MKTINLDLLLKTRRIRKNKTCLGESIEKRPTIVDDREEFGHWEIDTVIGLKKGGDAAIMTLIERKTRFEIIMKVGSKAANSIPSPLITEWNFPGLMNYCKTRLKFILHIRIPLGNVVLTKITMELFATSFQKAQK